ncbi:hypothetical protein KEF29_29760 [Streptomyces tuirus]|uniref:Uncharacterized protein n=1 Tax=Streptomyces tuirus TaxID=68278 RepID=A0A941FCM1_9ACTN|nr:hypothetical protein [Streptomyces tuirus]
MLAAILSASDADDGRTSAVRPGQRPNRPQRIAAGFSIAGIEWMEFTITDRHQNPLADKAI